jgi:hypothetical protein
LPNEWLLFGIPMLPAQGLPNSFIHKPVVSPQLLKKALAAVLGGGGWVEEEEGDGGDANL